MLTVELCANQVVECGHYQANVVTVTTNTDNGHTVSLLEEKILSLRTEANRDLCLTGI